MHRLWAELAEAKPIKCSKIFFLKLITFEESSSLVMVKPAISSIEAAMAGLFCAGSKRISKNFVSASATSGNRQMNLRANNSTYYRTEGTWFRVIRSHNLSIVN